MGRPRSTLDPNDAGRLGFGMKGMSESVEENAQLGLSESDPTRPAVAQVESECEDGTAAGVLVGPARQDEPGIAESLPRRMIGPAGIEGPAAEDARRRL